MLLRLLRDVSRRLLRSRRGLLELAHGSGRAGEFLLKCRGKVNEHYLRGHPAVVEEASVRDPAVLEEDSARDLAVVYIVSARDPAMVKRSLRETSRYRRKSIRKSFVEEASARGPAVIQENPCDNRIPRSVATSKGRLRGRSRRFRTSLCE